MLFAWDYSWQICANHLGLLAQEAAQQPLIMRLDGGRRAIVLAALASLVILGFLLITLTWLGGRVARRYMNAGVKPKPTLLPSDEEWTRPTQDPQVKPSRMKG